MFDIDKKFKIEITETTRGKAEKTYKKSYPYLPVKIEVEVIDINGLEVELEYRIFLKGRKDPLTIRKGLTIGVGSTFTLDGIFLNLAMEKLAGKEVE